MANAYFVMESIYKMTQIPIYYFCNTSNVILYSQGYEPDCDPILCDINLRTKLLDIHKDSSIPQLEYEDLIFVYAVFKDSSECTVILGPICIEIPNTSQILSYAGKHSILSENFDLIHKSLVSFNSTVSLLYLYLTGKYITETDLVINQNNERPSDRILQSECQNYLLHNSENEVSRMTFSDEMSFFQQIKDGNVEGVKSHFNLVMVVDKVPTLAKNQYKHYEYMICSAITLATRTAIHSGVDPTSAYAMSDLYLHSLENCKTITELFNLQKNVMIGFATKVQQVNLQNSQVSNIEKCKNYIVTHLNKHFTLEDIAHEIHISKSYLSRQFSNVAGIGINKYTQKKRIEAATNMLKYSNESISVIASYLCFPSQSHFGKVFKDHMGLTPKKFRDKEKLQDFMG